ncbi:hypothetical protein EUX98_g8147 [Antrodiella citrinella]|uniref:DUF6532 domain-containing protein n=1 Tax=Antrodiella citrinella TaxID=2447956 RepID=A0A4S4MCM5_9APHY|nr:hypothetical protein EUX98_g8147 [Antrodiella citrinella]
MGRTALELIGQGGLGYSFDPLTEDIPNAFGQAMKAFVPAIFTLGPIRFLTPYVTFVERLSFKRTIIDNIPLPTFQKVLKLVATIDQSTKAVYEGKKAALATGDEAVKEQIGEGKDIMSILLRENMLTSEADRLGEDELLGQMTTLIFAATDTTSGALTQILHLLAEHPDTQERVRAEVKAALQDRDGDIPYDEIVSLPYMDAVCRETLRLYPPVPYLYRQANQTTSISLLQPIPGSDGILMKDITIPKDTITIVGIRSCNRNKAIWGEDALEWKPERWLSPLPDAVIDARVPGVYSNLTLCVLNKGVPKRNVVPVNRYKDDDESDTDADDVAFAKAAQAQQAKAQQKRKPTVKTKAVTPAKKSARLVDLDGISGDTPSPVHSDDEEDPQDEAFAGPAGSASNENEEGSHVEDESGDESEGLEASTVKQIFEQEVPTWAGSMDGDDDDDNGLLESFTAPSRPKVTKTYGHLSSGSQVGRAPTQDASDQRPENDHSTASADKKPTAARSSSKKHTGPASLFDADNMDVSRGSSRTAGHGTWTASSKSRSVTPHAHGPKKTPKGATKASSRRQQKAKMEQPSIESSDSDASDEDADMDVDTDNIPPGGRRKASSSGNTSGGCKWPEFTNFLYNKCGKINKLVQSDEMRRFIEECSEWVIHDIAFITFYPEGKDKYTYLIRLMMKVSEDGEFPIIVAQMRSDPVYARDLTHIPSNNVSHYRKNVLRAICPLVDAAYNLSRPAQPGAPKRTISEIKARVAALKVKHCYLFALAPGDGVQCITAKPFEHPMVAIAL